ncbi:CMRF35-like molecule 8 [Esox lucius]|uniref:CMRF35-like molecule 8 n=1 Tax=Esox lucius TaxID=8010 RepID=UPI001476E432|nr:CMRF35-like molecule 8 [Esox lucius]
MRILLIFILLSFMTGCVSSYIVPGYSGGTVIIYCQYNNGEKRNGKYFCREHNTLGCEDKIRSGSQNTWQHRGRFSLYDDTEGNYFNVVIKQLTRQDKGTYWCGVDKLLKFDKYTRVDLEVKEESTKPITTTTSIASQSTPQASTSSFTKATSKSPAPSSRPPSERKESDTPVVILVCVSVVVLLLLFSLLTVYKRKYNQNTGSFSSTQRAITGPGSHFEGCHGEGDYEEIKEHFHTSDTGDGTIYVDFPRNPSDSLHYARVNFHKDPSCPNEATTTITIEGTSSCDYATVNVVQNSTYSTVNHPHSTSEAPPIYSTVSKPGDT